MTVFETPNSSNLSKVEYDESTSRLYVTFKTSKSGKYVYENVPSSVFEALKESESKGKFFIANIKNNYKWSRV